MSKRPNHDREALQELLAIIRESGGPIFVHDATIDADKLAEWRKRWAGVVPVR